PKKPSPPTSTSSARPARASSLHLFRVLPSPGPLHRVGAAAKLVALLAIGVTLAVSPEWRTIAAMTAAVVVGLVVGRVPLGARPRLPRWFLAVLLVSLGLNF